MKLAIFSESAVDETAIRVLANAILGETTTPVEFPVRSRGWPSVQQTLPSVILNLYYQTDAEGLIVVADSDNSAVHQPAHAGPPAHAADCRYCQLLSTVEEARQRLTAIPGRVKMRIAVAVPTPSIEAWLRFASDPQCNEAAWLLEKGRGVNSFSAVQQLKQQVFGGTRSFQRMTEIASQAAAESGKRLNDLEQHFPNSFGLLAKHLREWIVPTDST